MVSRYRLTGERHDLFVLVALPLAETLTYQLGERCMT